MQFFFLNTSFQNLYQWPASAKWWHFWLQANTHCRHQQTEFHERKLHTFNKSLEKSNAQGHLVQCIITVRVSFWPRLLSLCPFIPPSLLLLLLSCHWPLSLFLFIPPPLLSFLLSYFFWPFLLFLHLCSPLLSTFSSYPLCPFWLYSLCWQMMPCCSASFSYSQLHCNRKPSFYLLSLHIALHSL